MKRFLIFISTVLFLAMITLALGGLWAYRTISVPGPFEDERTVMIAPGTSGYTIARTLADDGLIQYPRIFYFLMRTHPASVKAGEYTIPGGSNMKTILTLLQDGKVILRQVTLPEGMTVKQAIRLLNNTQYLTGELDENDKAIAEGSLLPETYSYTRGDTRQSLIDRMKKAQSDVLTELWATRDPSLPLKDLNELVTLASIVEKETGVAHERAKIAGLFYNRLKIGMPLQTDPTVVYVITKRLGHMEGKPLLRTHLDVDSPYNTYKVVGLPPAPIANPGRASLEAVLKPETHNYLFFVADGTGGHTFSKNLSGHNQNVQKWRVIKRKKLQDEKTK